MCNGLNLTASNKCNPIGYTIKCASCKRKELCLLVYLHMKIHSIFSIPLRIFSIFLHRTRNGERTWTYWFLEYWVEKTQPLQISSSFLLLLEPLKHQTPTHQIIVSTVLHAATPLKTRHWRFVRPWQPRIDFALTSKWLHCTFKAGSRANGPHLRFLSPPLPAFTG